MASVDDGSCYCNGTTIDLPHDFARKVFRECLYTHTDAVSFFIGLSSLAFWMFAQAPQFVLNCKLGRAKGLSLCFLLEWLTGDTLNLAGALLTGQVGTAIATSLLFVSMDVTLASQYLFLERPCCRNYDGEGEEEQEDAEDEEEELDNPLLNDESHLNGNTYGSTPQHSERTERSKRALYSIFLPVIMLGALTVGSGGFLFTAGSNDAASLQPFSSLSQVARARGGKSRKRSLLSSSSTSDSFSVGTSPSVRRPREQAPLPGLINCDATPPPSLLGKILSWLSAAIYLLSRMPQIVKNYRRRSVEGLSPILFACAVLGNTTYALGIIIKGQRLLEALPFLIGSIGTLMFDATILTQFFIYRGLKPKRRRLKKSKKEQLEGVHGVSHWANSPFTSPGARTQKLEDEKNAVAVGQQSQQGGGKHSGLNQSYSGSEWSSITP